ncbi:MAG: alpha/beta hydrolase [Marmoricola sp.]|nr:alpha/beta hydrolase [Marmoricola sp.]
MILRLRRACAWGLTAIATLLVRVLVRFEPQRWCPPAVTLRLTRASSEPGGTRVAADVRRHLPSAGWVTRADLRYAPGGDATFDLVLPDSPGPHPWILWVHGGGWHFGDKSDVLPYVELLATHGFAGAAVNYPHAPRAAHPAAPVAVQQVVDHLLDHAAEYGLDPGRFVLAGDSAGAQIAGEVAAQLAAAGRGPRGALLFCGIFDPVALGDSDRMFAAVLESAMRALTGTRTWQDSDPCRSMSVIDRATGSFPPTFLAAGNADPLTRHQSVPMATRLQELGVHVETYFPGDAAGPINHEFQFRLDTPEGAEALSRTLAFLERVTAS